MSKTFVKWQIFNTADKRHTGSHSFPVESSRGAVWNSNHMHMQNFGFDFSLGYIEIFELFGLDRI